MTQPIQRWTEINPDVYNRAYNRQSLHVHHHLIDVFIRPMIVFIYISIKFLQYIDLNIVNFME